MLDLKHVVRGVLDTVRDGVAVGGGQENRSQDEHVERALQHFPAISRFLSTHDSQHIPQGHLPEGQGHSWALRGNIADRFPRPLAGVSLSGNNPEEAPVPRSSRPAILSSPAHAGPRPPRHSQD